MFFKKAPTAVSWIVVFLGNPGPKYNGTRHNVGFMTADIVEKKKDIRIDRIKFNALTAVCQYGDEKVLLMKPQTYMNLSGNAVHQAASFYNVPVERILVISDDISMPLGKVRIRAKGSAGGHNGLKDIIAKCGGEGFPRIKVGVGIPPHPDYDVADWVLSTFKNKDAEDIDEAMKKAADAIDSIITEGIDRAMNKYN